MTRIDTPADLSFVKTRYKAQEARFLIQMNKTHAKIGGNAITPYHLVPFWFCNEPAPKGFARIKAPVLPQHRQTRMMALYHHAQSGNERSQQVAALYVNVILWATVFPEECAIHYEVDAVFDFTPEGVQEWLEANTGRESKAYAAGFDLMAADCVRIAYNSL